MTVTVASFRTSFTAFSDSTKYPDGMVAFWLATAGNMLDAGRWGNLLDYGTSLFMAHYLTLAGADAQTVAFGGNPGEATGPTSNKSVDKVSIGFDTASAAEEGAGNWNMTTYGQQYIRQARIIGAGAIQVEQVVAAQGVDAFQGISLYSGAWPGPFNGY